MTVLDLLNRSAKKIGVLGEGETLSANQASDAFADLKAMLNTWSTQNLLIFNKVEETFTLVGAQQSYTMGTGGNFNTTRPQKIENAYLRTTAGSTTYDLPIDILTQDQWANISVKSVQGSIPTKLFAQGSYPLETILLWPIPNAAKTLVLWSWKPLSTLASINATVDLPPGYEDAIVFNYAIRMASDYGKTPSEILVVDAMESKASVKRMNSKSILLSTDAALVSKRAGFNYLTGE